MFTKEEIAHIQNISNEYRVYETKLKDICTKLVKLLNYDYLNSPITIDNDFVYFTGIAYGSYQSEWRENFKIPISHFEFSPEKIVQLKKEEEARIAQEHEEKIIQSKKEKSRKEAELNKGEFI